MVILPNINLEYVREVLKITKKNTFCSIRGIVGNVEVVRTLYENGAEINSADNVGKIPLHSAASNGNYVIISRNEDLAVFFC